MKIGIILLILFVFSNIHPATLPSGGVECYHGYTKVYNNQPILGVQYNEWELSKRRENINEDKFFGFIPIVDDVYTGENFLSGDTINFSDGSSSTLVSSSWGGYLGLNSQANGDGFFSEEDAWYRWNNDFFEEGIPTGPETPLDKNLIIYIILLTLYIIIKNGYRIKRIRHSNSSKGSSRKLISCDQRRKIYSRDDNKSRRL